MSKKFVGEGLGRNQKKIKVESQEKAHNEVKINNTTCWLEFEMLIYNNQSDCVGYWQLSRWEGESEGLIEINQSSNKVTKKQTNIKKRNTLLLLTKQK